MPNAQTQTEIKWHPNFSHPYDQTERYSEVYDFTISETELFKVPSQYAIWVFDENGTKHRHYKHDEVLIKAQTGRNTVYFRNKKAAEANGYKFSFRCQMFMKEEDQDFYGTERILNYHSSARTDYSLPEDEWKVGCEVEKEDSRYNSDTSVWKLFQETGWAKERDSSLGDGGFELVSPILPLWDRARLKKAMRPVKKYLNANQSNSCGGHINISCKGKSSTEVLESFQAGAALLYAIYQPRMTNRYCHVKNWNRYFEYPDKYSSFYLKSEQVMEIRLFPAVKSLNNLMWRLDLVRWLVQIDQASFVKKILSLNNQNGYLKNHLRKIYSDDKIRDVAQRAIKHYQKWIAPLTQTEKTKLEVAGFVVDPNRIVDDVLPSEQEGGQPF